MGQLSPPRRVLVVDDHPDAANAVADLLEALGHTAATAFGGKECLEKAENFCPDLIFLDINMPGMDGFETAAALRRRIGHRSRIVALTSMSGPDVLGNLADAAFDAHLRKPASIRELLQQVLAASAGELPNHLNDIR